MSPDQPAPPFAAMAGMPKPVATPPPPSYMPQSAQSIPPSPTRSEPVSAPTAQPVQANLGGQGSRVQHKAKLVIQRGGTVGKEFALTDSESNIGRWDADGGIFPDVDLDQDDPEAKVSRRHARIIHQNGQYLIEDLGSTNGTFINRGRRLLPGNRHPLNNGDEIIVGKTFLKFVVE
ncbi:MAG: FHA domain-containing protein [Blastocatellia bacterium]|nr:FHA domain-containing protein [Blastocatellia bacterium]